MAKCRFDTLNGVKLLFGGHISNLYFWSSQLPSQKIKNLAVDLTPKIQFESHLGWQIYIFN